jgi:hypothetical protein
LIWLQFSCFLAHPWVLWLDYFLVLQFPFSRIPVDTLRGIGRFIPFICSLIFSNSIMKNMIDEEARRIQCFFHYLETFGTVYNIMYWLYNICKNTKRCINNVETSAPG